jgi:hypothetical protein
MRMNRQIWQGVAWLSERARGHEPPVLDPLPFATLADSARAALSL